MRITYIGHATLLIEIGGRTFLTDPNFDSKLGKILPRVSEPGIALNKLPALDAVFITHAHADHLSFDSLDGIAKGTPVYAPRAIASWLTRKGYENVAALIPGEVIDIGGVSVRAASATHKGHRYGVDRWRGAANMYLFDTKTTSCFFAGDTALTSDSSHMVDNHLIAEGRRLDLALLPIGHPPGWKESSFRKGHLTTTDALMLFERLDARYLIPYHWGTFDHVTSKAHDAIEHLREQIPAHARGADVEILEPGMSFNLPENVG
jgi:L-ascorbate metabolism protein UlaG (beta-lactamase superfamily)